MDSARDPVPFRRGRSRYDAPTYGSTHKRHPLESLVPLRHTITEITGPRFSPALFPPIPELSLVNGKAALGERIIVHGGITDEDGRPVPRTIVEIWQANASGRYQHPGDRPQFSRRGPRLHRRGRLVPVYHRQTRRLSLAQPSQCLAAEPHPFLVLRNRFWRTAGHADVFSGRPVARARSDLSVGARRSSAQPAGLQARHGRHRARMGARLSL